MIRIFKTMKSNFVSNIQVNKNELHFTCILFFSHVITESIILRLEKKNTMSLSKYQLSASLQRTCLSLEEKIKVLDYAAQHPNMGSRKIADHFGIGKTAASNILKEGNKLRKDFETFKGTYKKRRHGKYHVINEILYHWYGKCTSANIYPDGSLLQIEAMEIKKRLDKEELSEFSASNGWLESWKKTYGIRETRLA